MCAARKRAGYSLIELMVVLAIVAISLTLAAPSLGAFARGMQVRSARDTLLASLQRTRFEAVRHNARVVMCKSVSGTACSTQGRWHQGWIIFHDGDGNGQFGAGETILHRESALPAGVRVVAGNQLRDYVSFVAQGNSRALNGAMQIGNLEVCAAGAPETAGFKIVLRSSGRTRVEKSTQAQCS